MPLRLTKRKASPFWQIVGAVGGVRVRESTQTTSRSLADSLRIAREAELESRRVHGPKAVATFAEAVNAHLDGGGEKRYLLPLLDLLGRRLLSTIDQITLDATARTIYPNAAPSTLNRQAYTPFIAVWNTAAHARLCEFRRWRRPRGHNKRTRFRWLWPTEFEAVWSAAPPHGRVLLDLFAGTGLRESEGVGLEWGDVALPLAQAWIWKAKNDEPRRIELPARTVAALEALDHRAGEVLLDGGGAPFVLSPNGGGALKTSLHHWARDGGVEPFGAHVLRHTFATWFYSQTLDRERLRALGGWLSDEVDRYCHLAPRGLSDELRRHGWDFTGAGDAGKPCVKSVSANGDVPRPFATDGDNIHTLHGPEKKARRQ